jgi:mRNA-degrading endonuclease RelE of RelBE toxin-antitoxin system
MQVLWSEGSERVLLSLPPTQAERIIDAVVALAEKGRGFVRRTFDPPERRLHIKGYSITFEVEGDTMFVLAVHRSRVRR